MRALITGATGYLGTAMLEHVPEGVDTLGIGFRRASGATAVDITDHAQLTAAVDGFHPEVIIHLAAVSRVPEADRDPDGAMRINATGSGIVARVAAEQNVRLVALSSDNVFDGAHPPYAEDSPVGPLGPYGRSKVAAEEAIQTIHPEPVILRTTLLIGADRADRRPFSVFVMSRADAGLAVELYENERRNFFPVTVAARAVWEAAVRPELAGIYHLGAVQSATRYDFGRALIERAGLDIDLAVRTRGPSHRPADLTMDVSKAQHDLATPLPTIDEALAETLRDMGMG